MVITILRFNKSNESNPRILCGVPCKKQAIVGASRDNHVPGSGGEPDLANCSPQVCAGAGVRDHFQPGGGKVRFSTPVLQACAGAGVRGHVQPFCF